MMHDYTISYYCYCIHYFTVYTWQVISFIVLSIQSIIIRNSKVGVYFKMNTIFVRFDSFHIFNALTFILHHWHQLFSFSILSHSYYNFYFEVTLFFVETITIIIEVSQVVKFKSIQSFRIINNNTTIHDYRINYYCYRHHYFTVSEIQVITFIFCLFNWPPPRTAR